MSNIPTFKAINLPSRLETHTNKPWQPECVLTVDSQSHSFKIATFLGAFPWHSHVDTDETFYCVSGGPFFIDINTTARSPQEAECGGADHSVELGVGDLFKVPRQMQHRPRATVEAGVLMIEKVGTVNTGDLEDSNMKVYVEEDV